MSGLTRNKEFLFRRNNFDDEVEEREGIAEAVVDEGGVFADAAGEGEEVEATEEGEEAADSEGEAVAEHVEGEVSFGVVAGEKGAHVMGASNAL